jgi:hypothetical protein
VLITKSKDIKRVHSVTRIRRYSRSVTRVGSLIVLRPRKF